MTGGSVLEIESTRDLSQTFLRILEEFRQRYLLSFSPRGVSSTGWHRLEVRVKGRRGTVNARAGYQAGRINRSAPRLVEIIFAMVKWDPQVCVRDRSSFAA